MERNRTEFGGVINNLTMREEEEKETLGEGNLLGLQEKFEMKVGDWDVIVMIETGSVYSLINEEV